MTDASREIVRDMLAASVVQIETERARYLASHLGKARARIALIGRLTRKLDAQAHDVGVALTRGTDALTLAQETAETVRDLRMAAADLEAFVRLHEAGGAPEPQDAA